MQTMINAVDKHRQMIFDAERHIWKHPETGYRAVGIKKIGKEYYYFEKTNSAAYLCTNCWRKFGSKYRYMDSKGRVVIGWKTINGSRYYFDISA